ncbi:CHASE2 domain-containing protein, partial [Candidatus Poribacteria bacterium]|nr:CHASE2 domain-containing protein [Candidatus Poribacteria bacterium]
MQRVAYLDGVETHLAARAVRPTSALRYDHVGKPDAALPDYVLRQRTENVIDRIDAQGKNLFPISTVKALPPIRRVGEHAKAIGSLVQLADADGGFRRNPLIVSYYDETFLPSLSLQIAAASLNLGPSDVEVRLGEGIRLGRLVIGTDASLQLYSFFYGDEDHPAFQADSAYDVLTGAIKPEKYRDKIVLIGATAAGVGDNFKTPVERQAAPVMILAHVVSSILNEDFFTNPEWSYWVKMLAFLLVAIYLMAAVPRMRAGPAAGVTIAIVLLLVAVELGMLVTQATWISLVLPTLLLVIGHAVLTTKRFLVTERGMIVADIESALTVKQLGLKSQKEGALDEAFELFRRLPINEANLDLLYNLAPEFERKRQFAKSVSVYEYIAQKAPDFRDVTNKLNRSKAMEQTVLIGGASMMSSNAATLIMDGIVEKPMLGRFQVEKELGKGAMGVVYLGKDPKIDRAVAIKTMALAQEFEDDQLDEAKERFFREAQTAGRLTHPNIVTIYDVGEEHDLAYIAMELLKGADLDAYTKAGALLSLSALIDITIASADALDYAHGENVVHRDIKPANIMYEPDSGVVKLTDFGIARITDSNKTKTGMVLGTPYYMSP